MFHPKGVRKLTNFINISLVSFKQLGTDHSKAKPSVNADNCLQMMRNEMCPEDI